MSPTLTEAQRAALLAVNNGVVTCCDDSDSDAARSYRMLYQSGYIKAVGMSGASGVALFGMQVTPLGKSLLAPPTPVWRDVKKWPWGKLAAVITFVLGAYKSLKS